MRTVTTAVALAAAALMITGCGASADPDDATASPSPIPFVTDTPMITPAPDGTTSPEPTDLTFLENGMCMIVELVGEGLTFEEAVPCDQVHNAEVYFDGLVETEETLGAVEQVCSDILVGQFTDPGAGDVVALPQDPAVIRDLDRMEPGDRFYCVFVFSEAIEGRGMAGLT